MLTISEGTTEITVDLSALEESAAITAVQDDVDANEAAANTAIALKEDAANKSTDGTLADDTDTKFPTEKAVKTYVDAQVGSLTTDDDITGATIDGASLLTISEGTTEITVDLSALEESAAITAVQDDVDANEAAANTAIALKEDAANKSTDGTLADDTDTKFPTEKAVKTYVDAQVESLTTDDDITGATIDGASLLTISEGTTEITVDLSALEESAAITAVQDDVDANEAAANTAIALKEDAANKSTDGSLADDTDTKFPTEKAVKTYVDAQVGSLTTDDDITGATIDGASLLTISEGTTEITVDLSALEESAAITAVQDDVDANEAAANTAIALKEDAANKSTDGSLADDTDTKFPTEKAVKTYVDAQVGSLTTDDDITGATIDGASLLTISEGTTEITVDLSALEESAAITAVQDDVDANEAAANTAIALKEDAANKSTDVTTDATSDTKYPSVKAVKTYVDAQAQAQASGSVADEINEGTTLVAPSQHAVFEALALKEDAANKSTDGSLADDTDTKFPTEKAVKTYVDAQVGSLTTDDDITGATIDGASLLTISEGTTEITVDLSALEESAAITAVQDDVDANEAAANTAIALKEDAANKSTDGTLADDTDTKFPTEKAVKTYVDAQVESLTTDDDITGATIDGASLLTISEGTTEITVDLSALEESAAITAVQDDVDANEAAANTAIALKEDAANKSTDGSLADDTDTKFPTEKAVKTYVDAQVESLTTDDDITGATIDGASLLTISEGTTEITVDLSALEESAAITAVQDDVDANEAAANTAIALKEDAANKSTDGSLADDTDTKFPTEKAVKTYVDAQVGSLTTDDDITGATIDGASLLTISEGTTEITVDLSALEESAAITAVQDDVDANEAAANTAIALKEDAANKSTDVTTDADSDIKYPSVKAVKTYVDAQAQAQASGSVADEINEGTTLVAPSQHAVFEALALKEDAANKSTDGSLADDTDTKFPTEKAVKTYVDAQVGSLTTDDDITGATIDGASLLTISEGTTEITVDLSALEESAAITAVQDDVDANEAAANTAIALKEDAANKSTDGTLADDTDTKFPTEKAVKTYVDAQVESLTTDDDITGATIDGASLLTISEGTTEITVDLSALEESAAITAVQDDVDANEAAANTAIALKEDAANKSTDVTTDADSDIKYPSVKAVKTYVDAQAQAQASGSVADEINEGTTLVAPSQHAVFEALALKEDAANKSTDGTLADDTDTKFPTEKAVKTYVDAQVESLTTDDDITGATIDGASLLTISEGTTEITVDLSALEESAAITAVQDDVDANEAAANTAIALKEDAANKSTDGTLADDTDTKFPTEKAVKTYVDAQVESLTTDDDITGATIDGASLLTISEGTTEITVDLSALEESAAITAVQDDVDQNKSDADAAIALKEDVANKSTDVNLADDTDTKFPTEKAVKTYVDTKITTVSTQKDDVFTLQDEGDATKQAKFELSGIAAANTRTLTLPDADGTIALTTDLAGDFTAATSLGAGTSGLVPAPTTEADNAKFLKGDGTWAEVLTTVTANNVNLQTAVDIDADGSDETTVEAAITKLIAALTAATAPVVDGSTPIEFIYGETKEVTVTGNLIRPNHTLSNTGGFSSVYKSDSWSDSEITFNVTAPYEAVTEAPQNLSGSTQTINFSTLSPRLNATHNEVFIKGATRAVTFEGSNFHDQMELTGLPEGYVVTSGYVCCNNTSVVFNVTAPTTASPQTTVTLSDNLGTGSITFETMALEVGTPYGGGVVVWLNPNNPGHGYIMRNADEGQFKYGGYHV